MVGALEFLKAKNDICKAAPDCGECPLEKYCDPVNLIDHEGLIPEFVAVTMADWRENHATNRNDRN